MTLPEMPELPPLPDDAEISDKWNALCAPTAPPSSWNDKVRWMMRAYGEACARVERERCARIADDMLGCEADQIAAAIRGEPT